MGTIASQITSLAIVYSIVYSSAYQRKLQSSASLAFVRGIHRGPVNSPHKWPVTRKMFPFDDVIMMSGNVECIKDRLCLTCIISWDVSQNCQVTLDISGSPTDFQCGSRKSSVTLIYMPWGVSQLSLLIAACFDENCAVCGLDNIVKCYKCKHGYYLHPLTDRCERKWRLDGTILFTLEVLLYTLRCRLTFVFDNVVWAVKFYSKLLISCARNLAWVLCLQIAMGGKVLEHLKAQLWLLSSPVYIRAGWSVF